MYEKPPPSLPQYIRGTSNIEAVDISLAQREEMLACIRRRLLKAQETMKKYVDMRRIPRPFKLEDLVFVKLRPYRQATIGEQMTHKLSKRYYGPFKLIKQIGDVAFELELPPTSKIHPVFHVSQLKPCCDNIVSPIALPDRNSVELPKP